MEQKREIKVGAEYIRNKIKSKLRGNYSQKYRLIPLSSSESGKNQDTKPHFAMFNFGWLPPLPVRPSTVRLCGQDGRAVFVQCRGASAEGSRKMIAIACANCYDELKTGCACGLRTAVSTALEKQKMGLGNKSEARSKTADMESAESDGCNEKKVSGLEARRSDSGNPRRPSR